MKQARAVNPLPTHLERTLHTHTSQEVEHDCQNDSFLVSPINLIVHLILASHALLHPTGRALGFVHGEVIASNTGMSSPMPEHVDSEQGEGSGEQDATFLVRM